MTPIHYLPNELLLRIFALVAGPDQPLEYYQHFRSPTNLLSLSLVSHMIHSLVMPALYRQVNVTRMYKLHEIFLPLLRTLQSRPALAAYIKILTINTQYEQPLHSEVDRLFSLTTNLEKLHIKCRTSFESFFSFAHNPMKSLNEVHITNISCTNATLAIVLWLPSIRKVVVNDVRSAGELRLTREQRCGTSPVKDLTLHGVLSANEFHEILNWPTALQSLTCTIPPEIKKSAGIVTHVLSPIKVVLKQLDIGDMDDPCHIIDLHDFPSLRRLSIHRDALMREPAAQAVLKMPRHLHTLAVPFYRYDCPVFTEADVDWLIDFARSCALNKSTLKRIILDIHWNEVTTESHYGMYCKGIPWEDPPEVNAAFQEAGISVHWKRPYSERFEDAVGHEEEEEEDEGGWGNDEFNDD